jgi:hypothetical protein
MRQSLLWAPECKQTRTDVWHRLPEESRAELVAQLVRLVVESAVSTVKPARSERGDHGLKGSSATS